MPPGRVFAHMKGGFSGYKIGKDIGIMDDCID
jgi:hypothetical protein